MLWVWDVKYCKYVNYLKSCFDITFVIFGNSFYTSPAEFTIVIVTISGVDCVNVSKFWNEFQIY